jgi:hypothetical protein
MAFLESPTIAMLTVMLVDMPDVDDMQFTFCQSLSIIFLFLSLFLPCFERELRFAVLESFLKDTYKVAYKRKKDRIGMGSPFTIVSL